MSKLPFLAGFLSITETSAARNHDGTTRIAEPSRRAEVAPSPKTPKWSPFLDILMQTRSNS